MKFQRVAVIDSGIGGMSVLKELVEVFPQCNFIYFGDNKNAPYGNRTIADLYSISLSNLSFVLSFNVDAVVFACNTVSVSVLQFLRDFSPVPLFGIYPPIESEMVHGNSVLLLATDVTADKYKGLKNVVSVGLSGLVKHIEDNKFNLKNLDVAKFLPSNKTSFYTVILGCTHFPIIAPVIRKVMGEKVSLIDSGKETAGFVKKLIEENNLLNCDRESTYSYFVSDDTENFKNIAEIFLQGEIDGEVERVDIGKYKRFIGEE